MRVLFCFEYFNVATSSFTEPTLWLCRVSKERCEHKHSLRWWDFRKRLYRAIYHFWITMLYFSKQCGLYRQKWYYFEWTRILGKKKQTVTLTYKSEVCSAAIFAALKKKLQNTHKKISKCVSFISTMEDIPSEGLLFVQALPTLTFIAFKQPVLFLPLKWRSAAWNKVS